MKDKVAIINSVYKYGSTGRICQELCEFLNSNGYDSKVFYGRKRQKKDNNSVYFSLPLSVLSHAFLAKIFDKDSYFSILSTKILINELKKYKPTIMFLNNLHGYYINIKLLFNYIKSRKIKVFYILHDCWPFTGHCAHFDYNNCANWKARCEKCRFSNSYPSSIFSSSHNNFLRKTMLFDSSIDITFVCPSNWMKQLLDCSILQGFNSVVINNGIDFNKFGLSKELYDFPKELTNKKKILCASSVWNKRKGINDIFMLSEKLNDNEIIILLGKTKRHQFNDKIYHIDEISNIDVLNKIYNSCDVFLNTTYEDNFPTVNLEALRCNLPVVCYRTGGAIEMVDPNFVVEKGDINASLILIRKLIADKNIYNSFKYDSSSNKIMYSKYLDLIKK